MLEINDDYIQKNYMNDTYSMLEIAHSCLGWLAPDQLLKGSNLMKDEI